MTVSNRQTASEKARTCCCYNSISMLLNEWKHKFTVSLNFIKFHLNANFIMSNAQQNPQFTAPSLWGI